MNTENTRIFRMLCAMFNLKKKNANIIVHIFSLAGYEISKSRAMNLLSKSYNMSSDELHCFIEGIFEFRKENGFSLAFPAEILK